MPILSIAARLGDLGLDLRLYYVTCSRADTAFAERIALLCGERLHLHHSGGDVARRLDVAGMLRVRPPGTHAYVRSTSTCAGAN